MIARRRVSPCLASALLLAACGDSGGATGGASATMATTVPTSVTATDGSSGSASATTGGDPTTSGSVSDSVSGSTAPTTTVGGTTEAPPKFDLGVQPDGGMGGCNGGGDVEFSYIWISNSPENTVSKIDSLIAANSGVYARIQRVG